MARECKYCIYAKPHGSNDATCWRYPPTVHVITNANGETDFVNERPYVDQNDTCGEWENPNPLVR